MKKNIILMSLLSMGLAFISCEKNEDNNKNEYTEEEAQNLDYTSAVANAWGNYAVNVANLLQQDANTLYNAWATSYDGGEAFATQFKGHTSASGYSSAEDCVEEILQGCIDIANEVGTAKIGEPYDYYTSGKTNQALYAVESWYSYHSRDDYKNNILSIANSLLGQPITGSPADFDYNSGIKNGSVTYNSIIVKSMQSNVLRTQSIDVWRNVCAAWTAIDAIPQPFRNNIASSESEVAMDACAELVKSLETLQGLIADNLSEDDCQSIVNQFVDVVALPTYKDLVAKNTALANAVKALQANPSNSAFESACNAWLAARQPWECSEAFLFGPVANLGLDPNMDSWPLDAVGIANLLNTQSWSDMQWSGNYDEESSTIEAAQAVRGFHTLEFLLFKNGTPRTVK